MKRILIMAATIIAAIIFVGTLVRAALYVPEDSMLTPPQSAFSSASPENYPVRLEIPSLKISADVQHVGIAKSGNMAVPTDYADVGWYRHGAVPGKKGSAVMDGHVDNGFALPGVFNQLFRLKPGDSIYVEEKDGGKVHFIVEKVVTYPYREVPVEELFMRNDTARLNLITCRGNYDPEHQTYDYRLVVYSVLAPEG